MMECIVKRDGKIVEYNKSHKYKLYKTLIFRRYAYKCTVCGHKLSARDFLIRQIARFNKCKCLNHMDIYP